MCKLHAKAGGLTSDDLLNPFADPLLVGNETVPAFPLLSPPPTPILPDYPHLLLIGREIDMRRARGGHYGLVYLNVGTTNEKNDFFLPHTQPDCSDGGGEHGLLLVCKNMPQS